MIGIDTNILVRYLTQDDRPQSAVVNDFVEKIVRAEEKLFVNLIVICELVWVLEDCYQYTKQEIIEAIRAICAVHVIEIESRELVLQALHDFQAYSVDISDCIIGRFNHISKCSYTVSFDKRACKLETFMAIKQHR